METSQEKMCFVLCVSWGVGLSVEGNKLRLLVLSNLSVFLTRYFSFQPFNNGDRNFVTFNNNSFVPMGTKNNSGDNEKEHSKKQMLHHIHGNTHII